MTTMRFPVGATRSPPAGTNPFQASNAMPVWRGEGDFLTLLKADPEVSAKMSDAEIEECFDLGYHLKQVDTIFTRVFGRA